MNIVWVLGLITIGYIIYDIYRDKDKFSMKSFENWSKLVKKAKTRDYIYSFLFFVFVFILIRGFVIGNHIMQECNVWEGQGMLKARSLDPNFNIVNGELVISQSEREIEVKKKEWSGNINNLEKNRSYNYYRRYFNENGGRPNTVSVVCEIRLDRFIKNIELDYKDREFINEK